MNLRIFRGIPECVEQWVNDFAEEVDVSSIQTHAAGPKGETLVAAVIYKEGSKDGR